MNAAREFQSPQIRLERIACPRCAGVNSSPVYTAHDYIYGLPGTFYAESCDDCGLWFQNPRPVETDIPLLYPDTYAPHAESTPARFTPSTRPANVLRNIWRGWNSGYLTRRLGYQHRAIEFTYSVNESRYRTSQLAPAASHSYHRVNAVQPRATRFVSNRLGAVFGSAISRAARWRAGCDLIPRFVPEGRLLELGCGTGETLKRLRDLGWRDLYGVEISDSAARIARRSGFTVKTETIATALESYPDGWFDAIVAEMVLEHLTDPFKSVAQIARKLKPGGEFLFSTVIRDSIDGRVFGRYGVCYDFPRHMVFFRKRDLNNMLRADFDRVQSWHQSTPIDFQRPAYLRSGRFDPELQRFFKTPAGERVVRVLARLKLMGRVSYRCRRKP